MDDAITLVAAPGSIEEGLFGGVLLHIFEILPALRKRRVFPAWRIASRLYGVPPDYTIIPGVFDLAYAPPVSNRTIDLASFRESDCFALGSDWLELHGLWHTYFAIPPRIIRSADKLGDLGGTLGIHYRGNDKLTNASDSNPISGLEFSMVVADFLRERGPFSQILVATDDASFADHIRQTSALPVVSLGAGRFHKSLEGQQASLDEADRALLDCLLLSRCGAVLQTSSALSAFAKILRPDLDIHRCAASKLFADVPYFPTAYIPAYESHNEHVRSLLWRTLQGDWTLDARAAAFRRRFAYRPRRLLSAATAPDMPWSILGTAAR